MAGPPVMAGLVPAISRQFRHAGDGGRESFFRPPAIVPAGPTIQPFGSSTQGPALTLANIRTGLIQLSSAQVTDSAAAAGRYENLG